MRLKNIPKAKGIVEASPLYINNPKELFGKWKMSFSKNKPLFIEIGCGKGQFIVTKSLSQPDSCFLGLEMYNSVLYKAINKAESAKVTNLGFLWENAAELYEIFAPGEIDGIFLNFSDPWPKKRHAKRRLTSEAFLNIYSKILSPAGRIEFKTDNSHLFEFSLESFKNHSDFKLLAFTRDLYSDKDLLPGNIPTEYEEKFLSQGLSINKLIAEKLQ